MSRLRVGVVGAGYLGKFHVRKYAEMPEVELTGVSDTSEAVRKEMVDAHHIMACADFKELAGKVDAVSIAAPTEHHFEIAKFFLEQGVHVLLEKPISRTVDEAVTLNRIASERKTILQIGHVERFNPAFIRAKQHLNKPVFMECHRLSPYTARSVDVSVVLDIMIHDLDLALHLAGPDVKRVESVGTSVLTPGSVDISNARVEFGNGCIANITASRIATQRMRKLRVFQKDAYLSIDFNAGQVDFYVKRPKGSDTSGLIAVDGLPDIYKMAVGIDKSDALRDELSSFVDCVRTGKQPLVSGREGEQALRLAFQVIEGMRRAE